MELELVFCVKSGAGTGRLEKRSRINENSWVNEELRRNGASPNVSR